MQLPTEKDIHWTHLFRWYHIHIHNIRVLSMQHFHLAVKKLLMISTEFHQPLWYVDRWFHSNFFFRKSIHRIHIRMTDDSFIIHLRWNSFSLGISSKSWILFISMNCSLIGAVSSHFFSLFFFKIEIKQIPIDWFIVIYKYHLLTDWRKLARNYDTWQY